MPKIASEISKYYSSGVEAKRLLKGVFQLERVRTQELILRFLSRKKLKILKETKRVLKKDGKVIAVGITRYASMFEGFFHGALKNRSFISMMNQDLESGQHRNKTKRFDYFTTSYFHHPKDLQEEINEADFKSLALLAVESFGWLIPNFENVWGNLSKRIRLLNTIRKTESDSYLMAVSAHIMAVGVKK